MKNRDIQKRQRKEIEEAYKSVIDKFCTCSRHAEIDSQITGTNKKYTKENKKKIIKKKANIIISTKENMLYRIEIKKRSSSKKPANEFNTFNPAKPIPNLSRSNKYKVRKNIICGLH
ncbi:hypothetical protein OTU49_006032 [Cherax quadricarinatus]|uniref:Uncharacterized protein n=1 Tax=Cherax quadricarinatus TaxID=27406 RepID=A0AAW0X331_CHEQU